MRNVQRNVQTTFAVSVDLYYELWGPFLHLAIFEDPSLDLAAAFEATHRRYLVAIRGDAVQRILDVGCGGGAFAEWLADHTAAHVLGIDISDAQLARARKRVRPHLQFRKHSVMEVGKLAEAPFDAAVCLDAATYFPDKRAAVRRVAGVLARGARFLLIDWCRPSQTTPLQEELVLEPLCRYWGYPNMETASRYEDHFSEAGFRLLEREDLSERVQRNWELGYAAANQALAVLSPERVKELTARILRYGTAGVRRAKEQYYAAVFSKVAADAGLLRYTYFLAERR